MSESESEYEQQQPECEFCEQPANEDDLCGHGIADGVCCTCLECKDERDDSESDCSLDELE